MPCHGCTRKAVFLPLCLVSGEGLARRLNMGCPPALDRLWTAGSDDSTRVVCRPPRPVPGTALYTVPNPDREGCRVSESKEGKKKE